MAFLDIKKVKNFSKSGQIFHVIQQLFFSYRWTIAREILLTFFMSIVYFWQIIRMYKHIQRFSK